MYFNAGFKSFNITRWASWIFEWYEWVDQLKNGDEWICFAMKEMLKDQIKVMRR